MPVEIKKFSRKGKTPWATYTYSAPGKDRKWFAYTRFEAGQEPLIIGAVGGKPTALAVWHETARFPVLLDDRLVRIDLTEEERAQALATLSTPLGSKLSQADRVNATAQVIGAAGNGFSLKRGLAGIALVAVIAMAGFFGYWLWYVTSANTQYDTPGMDFNNVMPAALNRWGCDQLRQRFGNQNAPFGCVATDFKSWK